MQLHSIREFGAFVVSGVFSCIPLLGAYFAVILRLIFVSDKQYNVTVNSVVKLSSSIVFENEARIRRGTID